MLISNIFHLLQVFHTVFINPFDFQIGDFNLIDHFLLLGNSFQISNCVSKDFMNTYRFMSG